MGAEFSYLKSSRFPRVVVRSRNRAHSVAKFGWYRHLYLILHSSFQLRVELLLFGFVLLRSVVGPEKSHHPPAQPIRFKTKTNCVFVTHIFPRFKHCAYSYSQFPLARCDIFLCFYWLLCLLWSWFYTQANGAQTGT